MDNCTCISREIVSIVYGNDFTIEAHVSVYDKDEGIYKLLDLTGVKECQMRLVGTYRKVIGKNVAVSGSKVTAFFPGGSIGVGTYGVEITFVDSLGKGRIFERNLIGIVSASGEATVDNDIEGEAGEGLNVSVNVLTRIVRIGGGGTSGSGATDYNLLENRPSIGGVTLEGDRRPSDLGMYSKVEADEKFETKESAAGADKRVQGMLDGKVDKIPGKGLSANDLTDERAGKVDKLKIDGRANEYLNGAGIYSRPVRQGYGVSVADDNTVSVDPQVIARQSDVANVAADLAAQKAKEQGDIDRANAAISKEETDRKAAVAALQSLIDILNSDSNVDGSVKKTVADAVARVVAGAPEDLDTLKEIADYIASDKTGAAQLAAAISQLQTLTEKHTSDIAGNASGVAENKAGVAALKTLTAGHTKSIEDLGIAKQDALVSGTNIKTINNQSILGEGNISIEGGSSITVDSALSTTSENPVQNKVVTKALQTKANASDIPTKVSQLENDSKFATQTAVATGLATKADKDSLTSLESDITSLQTTVGNQDKSIIANAQAIQGKQDKLVSGTNIKTINNQSILGSGNISIEGGGSTVVVDDALSDTSENPVQNKVITTKVNSLETSLGSKASQTDLDNLSSTVTTQGQTITSIQAEIGDINTQLTEING